MIKKDETNNAIVCKLTNVRKHSNADNLQLATVAGDTVIVGLDAKEGDIVVYFDSNLALSSEFLKINNLYNNPELNNDVTKKGYFGKNGKVRAIKLRGEYSYGFICGIDYIINVMCQQVHKELEESLVPGVQFNEIDGTKICFKFVPNKQKNRCGTSNRSNRVKLPPLKTLMFPEHWDTKQFRKEYESIPSDRLLYIEEKVHGTSHRVALSKYERQLGWFETILKKLGVKIDGYEWLVSNGSRRVNLTKKQSKKPYYSTELREVVFNKLKPNLKLNEQLYLEIIGYDTNGGYIQKDFPYGCNIGEFKVVLYRVTINNEVGDVFDMGREYVYKRAEELGILSPTVFNKYFYTGDVDSLCNLVESYTSGVSDLDSKTMKEGVVIWFENKNGIWSCLKNKSIEFLVKECKRVEEADFIDIEEVTGGEDANSCNVG